LVEEFHGRFYMGAAQRWETDFLKRTSSSQSAGSRQYRAYRVWAEDGFMSFRHVLVALVLAGACASTPPAANGPEIGQVETAAGVSLYYEKYGAGPEVVIIPGRLFLGDAFRSLVASNRTLILYDMRNRGASGRVEDGATLTVMEDVRDLEAMRAHFGAERFTPVGFSYLGVMVALYAAEHPERVERLVQIGPAPRDFDTEYPPEQTAGEDTLPPEAFAARDAARQLRTQTGVSQRQLCESERGFSQYMLVGDPANIGRVSDPCPYENEWPDNLNRHFSHHFADIQRRDFPASMFTGLTQPVLTLHGTLDRNAPYGAGLEWARTFPNARLVTVEGGAHVLWADDPSIVEAIDTFISGEWPTRAQRVAQVN
jgi:pimeloyl-ACP methyl ester carboxylesterase